LDGRIKQKGGEPDMRTTLTRALVGLGLAGALFLGAGAAVAQTADDSSASSSTTTAQDSQSTQSSNQNGAGTPADCPDAQSDSGQSGE
jgi:hypothetical protein